MCILLEGNRKSCLLWNWKRFSTLGKGVTAREGQSWSRVQVPDPEVHWDSCWGDWTLSSTLLWNYWQLLFIYSILFSLLSWILHNLALSPFCILSSNNPATDPTCQAFAYLRYGMSFIKFYSFIWNAIFEWLAYASHCDIASLQSLSFTHPTNVYYVSNRDTIFPVLMSQQHS